MTGKNVNPEALEIPAHQGLLKKYPRPSGVFDEMCEEPEVLRVHWGRVIRTLEALGLEELERRQQNAKRLIRENGVTYNIYGDPQGTERPLELDIIPLPLADTEWRTLEKGLTQRAFLFNLILADLYGEQRILKNGLLPPELVFGNPGFLRPCQGVPVPNNIYLHLYAADLARAPNGQWCVLADRTQAPSGAGYALENRIVLSRVFPDLFRDSQVRRLATFFRAEREMLWGLATLNKENPRIVLLTPGPYNETYFEHVYLARYLGLTLVEGGDLMVRDRHVYLKTLDGLQPIDVILRRVDDNFCDPLEFLGESFLGVAGLLEAVRAGTVAVANTLGSGVIETPALIPFLPSLCRYFLDEELKIPSIATGWCGSSPDLNRVLDHLDEFVIKPANPGNGMEPIFCASLPGMEKSRLMARLRARPTQFVSQEKLALSTAPVWSSSGLEPRPMVLRANLTRAGDTYQVLPGGLTRISSSPSTLVVSMQKGGGSKDTWVLSEEPVEPFSLLNLSNQPVQLKRSTRDLPSRVADNLFWLGRYAERSEGEARLLRTVLDRLIEESRILTRNQLDLSLRMVASLWPINWGLYSRPDADALKALEDELICFIFDEKKPYSLQATLNELHRVAGSVRDRLSFDTVRILNQLVSRPKSRSSLQITETLPVLNRWIYALAAFRGMERENMTRGQGWHFLHIGRRLERALYLIRLLRGLLVDLDPDGRPILEMVLDVVDSSMTYRSRYFATLELAPVLDLLLLDESNPRSLAYQLNSLAEHFRQLRGESLSGEAGPEVKIIEDAQGLLHSNSIEVLSLCDEGRRRVQLENLLLSLGNSLYSISNLIIQRYFSHAKVTQQMSSFSKGHIT